MYCKVFVLIDYNNNYKNHHQSSNHLKSKVMKKTIIYLGILASLFATPSFANAIELDQQNLETEVLKTESKMYNNVTSGINLSKPAIVLESEEQIVKSIAVVSSHYKRSNEEIILEDKKITESQNDLYLPLTIEPTVEDYIKLDNQIIESTITNEVVPIDLELINQPTNKMANSFDFKAKEVLKS